MSEKKVRVLQAIRQGSVGGGESHVLDLVKYLDRSKFEPLVLSFTEGQMVDSLRKDGVKTFVIPNLKPFNLLVWGKVKKLLHNENIDLLHAHGTRAASNVFWPASQMRIPMIYTIHGWSFNENQGRLKKQISIASESFLVNRASRNISVSQSNQETGKKHITNFNSVVVRNGINLDKFSSGKKYKSVRAELGIAESEIVIGFIVRITKQKDPFSLIHAFKILSEKMNNVTLLMVGDGDLKEESIAMAQSLGIKQKIIFQPFRQDIPNVLNSIDIYCLPSLWEGLSIGLLEAMAMGKAIVATNVDGTREVIKDRQNGLLIKPGNYQQLAETIEEVCRNNDLMKKIGAAAYQTVSKDFNVEKMTHQIEDVYLSLNKNKFQNDR